MGDICHNSRALPCPRAKHGCKTWTEGANVGRSQKLVSLKRIRHLGSTQENKFAPVIYNQNSGL